MQTQNDDAIRYVAIGDSYSIGEGATAHQAWPQLLADDLTTNGVATTLVANPGKTGWTTQQAIDNELPVLQTSDPDFVTIMLGVNDYVQGVSADTFREHLQFIVDQAITQVGADHLIVLTIPDYTVTPIGQTFGDPLVHSAGVEAFNQIIHNVAAEQSITVIDLFPISQAMATDSGLVAADGLHPSAKAYAVWERLIYSVVLPSLQLKTK